MRIKKLHGVIFAVVAVYLQLQRKTAWTLEYFCCKQLQYMAVLCNWHFHFHAAKSTSEKLKLNQLSTSVVKVWFNNRRQNEDSATSTAAATTNDNVVV